MGVFVTCEVLDVSIIHTIVSRGPPLPSCARHDHKVFALKFIVYCGYAFHIISIYHLHVLVCVHSEPCKPHFARSRREARAKSLRRNCMVAIELNENEDTNG